MVRHNYSIRALAVLLTAMAAAALVAVLVGSRSAEAAFPGTNGKIAFASSRVTTGNPEGDSEIFIMKPDGTGIEQLTSNDVNDSDPAWSAQGDAITFIRYSQDGSNPEIYVMDAAPESATNPAVRLTNNPTSDSSPAWSLDGNKIVFTSLRSTLGTTDIFVMDAKDEINNMTGDPGSDGNGDNLIRITTNNTKSEVLPAWSPDGSDKIAFTSDRDGNPEIYVMDAAPESATNIPVRLTNNAVSDSSPAWSPDGTKIAFTSDANPDPGVTNNDIFVMDAVDINPADDNGDNLIRLTKKAASDALPAWSPDGKKIAFRSDRGGGDPEVYVMKPRPESKRNRPKNLTKNDAFDSEPDWQPIPPP